MALGGDVAAYPARHCVSTIQVGDAVMGAPNTLLLVTTSYPRWGNGREAAGSFVADLAGELAKHVSVRVVAPGDSARIDEAFPNLTVYRYQAPQRRLVNLRVWNPVDVVRILRTLRSGQAAVQRAMVDGQVAHVLALWALPSGWWANATCHQVGVPYAVWMLGSDVWSLGRLPLVRGILGKVMRDARQRYADGLKLARDSEDICGLPVAFLPTTRKLETRDPPPPAPAPPYRFVFIGRWHRNKGVDLLLDALALLDETDWARISEVVIYGGGPLHALVREKAQPLLDAGRPLKIGGFIPKADAEQAIVRADWVVIPSRVESIPVVFSDAMKLGRPVIATPVGDLPGLVGNKCGRVCAAPEASAIALTLRGVLEGNANCDQSDLRKCATRFSLESIGQRLIADLTGSAL